MSTRAADARTVALALCASAVLMVVGAALVYTGTLDLGLDGSTRSILVVVLGVAAVVDLAMAWVMYQRLSAK